MPAPSGSVLVELARQIAAMERRLSTALTSMANLCFQPPRLLPWWAAVERPMGDPIDDPRTVQSPDRMSDNPGAVPDRESDTADALLAFADVSAILTSDRKRLSTAADIVRTQGLRTWCVPKPAALTVWPRW
jgi:hypothetical protein